MQIMRIAARRGFVFPIRQYGRINSRMKRSVIRRLYAGRFVDRKYLCLSGGDSSFIYDLNDYYGSYYDFRAITWRAEINRFL